MRKRLGGRYLEIQGRGSKKSGNLIAVLCCFADSLIFGVLEHLGLDPWKCEMCNF